MRSDPEKVAGLCGSDLHQYRYHDKFKNPCVVNTLSIVVMIIPRTSFVGGHEFAGEVVAIGSNYGPNANTAGRPALYATLKIGDKVVSPFTSSCSECQ